MRSWIRKLSVPCIFVVSCISANAASVLNFPRLSFEANTLTGLAIVNPSSETASVTFTAYGADGSLLSGSGFSNPATLTVPPNQQISKLLPEIFSGALSTSTTGWVQAVSSTDGLTGFFLVLDGSDTFLDGADLPASFTRIIFNQLRVDSGYDTEVNIINPGIAAATVSLQISGTGTVPASKTVSIPAKGSSRWSVASFFGTTALPSGAYLIASSDNPVAGFELVKSPLGEVLGLNARDATEQMSNLYFPQMAVLGSWSTELGVVNYAGSPVILTISANRPDGTLYGAPTVKNNPVTRALAAGASLREDVAELFGFSGAGPLDGWVHVESSSPGVNGYLSYGSGKLLASVSTASAGFTRTIFSHIGTAQGFFTGLAVLNPGTLAANVRIMAMQPSGTVLGSFDTVLQPGQRLSNLIDQLVPQAAGQSGGLIWIKSDRPVYAAELFGTGNTLANVPGQQGPDSYNPGAALPGLHVLPPIAPVQTGATQAFRADNSGAVTWKINGVTGGSASLGTISAAGSYRAPATPPSPQAITVTAELGTQIGGATADILSKQTLVAGLGIVQSVAYLGASAKLFDAEIATLSSAKGQAATTTTSGVFEISPAGLKTSVATYNGEFVAKMIPFTAQDGKEYLLLAGQTTGRIVRLNPSTKQSVDVASGLNQPSSLVIDPVSGNLFVAEADKVSIVTRDRLEPVSPKLSDPAAPAATLFSSGGDGIAADACTGLIYISSATRGEILEFNRILGRTRTIVSGLRTPRALLSLYRTGVSCPVSLQLLAVESGLDRASLIDLATGTVGAWIDAKATPDLTFMPRATPFGDDERVLIPEAEGQNGAKISSIRIPGLYGSQPPNPPYPILGFSPAVSLRLSPAGPVDVAASATQQFTTEVTGVANTAVLYSATGGTITDAGLFTAGGTAGTFAVIATSVAYPRVSAGAIVRVTPPPAAGSISTVSGNGTAGFAGDGGPAAQAQVNIVRGMASDAAGNLYFADSGNNRIRRISTTGIVTTVAGNGTAGFGGDGGPATSAQLNQPLDVEVDGAGNLYIADFSNQRIRKVSSAGIITTLAGTGKAGYNGDEKDALSTDFNGPSGVAFDTHGNLYVADRDNNRVRVIAGASGNIPAQQFVLTVAGTGVAGSAGDGLRGQQAQLSGPTDVVIGVAENTYIVDFGNNKIRRVDGQGFISTEVGTGTAGAGGNGGPATAAQLNRPLRIARDSAGNLYIGDTGNNVVRKVTPAGVITAFAGTGTPGFSGDGGPAAAAQLSAPEGVAVTAGGLFISDRLNFRIRRVSF